MSIQQQLHNARKLQQCIAADRLVSRNTAENLSNFHFKHFDLVLNRSSAKDTSIMYVRFIGRDRSFTISYSTYIKLSPRSRLL